MSCKRRLSHRVVLLPKQPPPCVGKERLFLLRSSGPPAGSSRAGKARTTTSGSFGKKDRMTGFFRARYSRETAKKMLSRRASKKLMTLRIHRIHLSNLFSSVFGFLDRVSAHPLPRPRRRAFVSKRRSAGPSVSATAALRCRAQYLESSATGPRTKRPEYCQASAYGPDLLL